MTNSRDIVQLALSYARSIIAAEIREDTEARERWVLQVADIHVRLNPEGYDGAADFAGLVHDSIADEALREDVRIEITAHGHV